MYEYRNQYNLFDQSLPAQEIFLFKFSRPSGGRLSGLACEVVYQQLLAQ